MPNITTDIHFPTKGLDVSTALDTQPVDTSANLRNVRGFEPGGDIDRGGQRPGVSMFADNGVEEVVQVMCSLTVVLD